MVISLIHPSRGRSTKAKETAKKWIEQAGGGIKIQHIFSLDLSDYDKDNYYGGDNSIILINDNQSVVEATNKAAKIAMGDIFLYLSDDFDCFPHWGLSVLKEFEGEDRPLLLKVDDCLQHFSVPVLTIPIMNRKLYSQLGYFWHPEYKSMFVDEHLYWVCKKLNCMKLASHLKFEHKHVSVGKAQDDETYRRSSANWEQGKAVFARHKAEGFPV